TDLTQAHQDGCEADARSPTHNRGKGQARKRAFRSWRGMCNAHRSNGYMVAQLRYSKMLISRLALRSLRQRPMLRFSRSLILMAGWDSPRRVRSSIVNRSHSTSLSAWILAERGARSMTAISPKAMPAEKVASRFEIP